jgi:hypothetical protein
MVPLAKFVIRKLLRERLAVGAVRLFKEVLLKVYFESA